MITEMLTSLMVLYLLKKYIFESFVGSFLHLLGVYITCQTKKERLLQLLLITGFWFYRTGVTVVSVFSTHTPKSA